MFTIISSISPEEKRLRGVICDQDYKGSCWQCRKIENKRKRSLAGLNHKAKQTKCISMVC